jgi:hypothetical protein
VCHTRVAGAPRPAAAQARAAGRVRRPTCGKVTTITKECHVVHWHACGVQVRVVTLHGYVSGCCLQCLCRLHCQSMAGNSQTHCYVSTTCCTSNLLCSTFCVPALWCNRAYYRRIHTFKTGADRRYQDLQWVLQNSTAEARSELRPIAAYEGVDVGLDIEVARPDGKEPFGDVQSVKIVVVDDDGVDEG